MAKRQGFTGSIIKSCDATMLEAEQITFHYDRHSPLLKGCSCRIAPGEVVGLPGPSGCGKSTLGKLLAGFLTPASGAVLCDQKPLPRAGYSPVQMIFQHPDLAVNPRWKVEKILREGNPSARELFSAFGVCRGWLSRYPHELSGGELQRITLIRAMTPSTRYLIADEMTASLDPSSQALIWKAVLQWARKNQVGILAISHDLELLQQISDRIDPGFGEDGG